MWAGVYGCGVLDKLSLKLSGVKATCVESLDGVPTVLSDLFRSFRGAGFFGYRKYRAGRVLGFTEGVCLLGFRRNPSFAQDEREVSFRHLDDRYTASVVFEGDGLSVDG